MSLNNLQDNIQQFHRQESGKWNINVGESSTTMKYGLIKLAPESPLRKSLDLLNDESSYDSFHNYETDICRDTSDDENSDAGSSHTTGFAIVDVLEYELAEDSESEDDSDMSSASSGGEFIYRVATVANHAFDSFIKSDDDGIIYADTEEDSDGSIDLELSHADYWHCVKCKHKKNNPMFRECQRCFQVRKSLFPPRPTTLKPRDNKGRRKRKMPQHKPCYSTEIDSDSESEASVAKKIALSPRAECLSTASTSNGSMNGNQLNIKDKLSGGSNEHANSAGELSCNNNTSSDDGDDGDQTVSSDADCKEVVRKVKVSPTSSIEISEVHVSDFSKYKSTSLIKFSHSRLDHKIENKIIQNVYRQEMCQNLVSQPNSQEWKDSGVSCQESSQEFSQESGLLVQSSSTGSTNSFNSQNEFPASQSSSLIQQDSDDVTDSEGILPRVEEFTKALQAKIMEETPSSSSLVCRSQLEDVNDSDLGICRFCMVNPKDGVFVHNNCLHLCCCYKCAKKVWNKRKSCPICNCKIITVKKLFVQ